jgi:hypothetical protein
MGLFNDTLLMNCSQSSKVKRHGEYRLYVAKNTGVINFLVLEHHFQYTAVCRQRGIITKIKIRQLRQTVYDLLYYTKYVCSHAVKESPSAVHL